MSLLPTGDRQHCRSLTARPLILWSVLAVTLFWTDLHGQVPDTLQIEPADTLLGRPPAQPVIRPFDEDTLQFMSPAITPAPATSSGRLNGPVRFTARDSLVLMFDQPGEIGRLIGDARVNYEDAELEAHEIDLFFAKDEMHARGLPTDTGMVGRPAFRKGSEAFTGQQFAYNMRTDRGRVVGARTAVEDGFLLGRVIKSAADTVIFVESGMYTTCDLEHDPHYSLRASRMKILNQEWIFSGPIHLRIFNIPLPVWLPFGMLPATEGRRSGPLAPTYGEDERGFYLRDFGWYWAMNDYMDFQTRLGIWSRGSWQVAPMYRYARRDRFSGEIQLDWTRNRRGEREDPDFLVQDTRSFRWRHDQTIDPTARIGANVDLSSTGYLRTISDLYDDRVRQTIGSNIAYNKRWPNAGRAVTVNLNHRQSLESGNTNLTLPSVSFNQSTRNPFRRSERRVGMRERWYERISYSYSANFNNRFNYVPLSRELADEISWWDALVSPSAYRRATGRTDHLQFDAVHRIPVSAPFSMERLPLLNVPFRLNLSPNINYSENWFIRTERRELVAANDTTMRVESFQAPGFFALRQFNMGVSGSTEFFGIFPFRIGAIDGFRHTVRPSLSFSYSPDYSDDFWGYYRTVIDQHGQEIRYPIVPGVPRGEQQTMGINISNVFQGRHVSIDTLGERTSRVMNLLNADVSTSYNFAADSLNFGSVNLSARTRLFDQFEINSSSQFSPYATDEQGRIINRFHFTDTGRPLRLMSFNISARTQLRSRRTGDARPFTSTRARIGDRLQPGTDRAFDGIVDDPFMSSHFNTPVGYADFAIPWSLNLDFTYRMSRFGTTTNRSAIMNTRFDFNLTPNWKIQGASGYDLTRGEFVATNISILRDLHCWEMAFNWVPFGRYQSFSFSIQVKSGHLRDILRLRQPRSDIRDRFGQLF